MATIVTVPAIWYGGWSWKAVRVGLQAAGHEVYTPTLTGLGERIHLATPEVDLDTHVQDVVNVLAYEDLRDVVLVGHSYGGMVVAGVADRAVDRLARQVYLDALLPLDGECAFDLLPGWRAGWEDRARQQGEGWRVPLRDPTDWRSAPQPLKTMQQPVRLTATGSRTLPGAYIHCTVKPNGVFLAQSVGRAKERGWPVFELATDHDPMGSAPQALVELLLKVI